MKNVMDGMGSFNVAAGQVVTIEKQVMENREDPAALRLAVEVLNWAANKAMQNPRVAAIDFLVDEIIDEVSQASGVLERHGLKQPVLVAA